MFAVSSPCNRSRAISAAIAALAVVLCTLPSPLYALNSVNILADSDTGLAIVRIARSYSREHEAVVNTSFVPQAAQEAQISEGGAADLLITTRLPWIEQLKTQGMVDVYSQTVIAHNRLVLAGPVDSSVTRHRTRAFPIVQVINAMGGEQAFVVGHPETLPVGVYGREALRKLGVADDLEPYTLYIKDPQQMLDMVTKHNAYGIFFSSTVAANDNIKVIEALPESSYTPIKYYAVVVAGENMNEARKFLEYLKSPEAKKLLKENGLAPY